GRPVLDAATGRELARDLLDLGRVYDFAESSDSTLLYLVRHDPQAEGEREIVSYVAFQPFGGTTPEARPAGSWPTGAEPVAVIAPAGGPFLVTADHGTNGLTLLNHTGDARAVPTCAAPRALLLSPDQSRMVVLCWDE